MLFLLMKHLHHTGPRKNLPSPFRRGRHEPGRTPPPSPDLVYLSDSLTWAYNEIPRRLKALENQLWPQLHISFSTGGNSNIDWNYLSLYNDRAITRRQLMERQAPP